MTGARLMKTYISELTFHALVLISRWDGKPHVIEFDSGSMNPVVSELTGDENTPSNEVFVDPYIIGEELRLMCGLAPEKVQAPDMETYDIKMPFRFSHGGDFSWPEKHGLYIVSLPLVRMAYYVRENGENKAFVEYQVSAEKPMKIDRIGTPKRWVDFCKKEIV